MKKKILFTGGSGLLALNWGLSIANEFDVILGLHEKYISQNVVRTVSLCLESGSDFSKILENIQPDVVIHCAGLANVEVCEANPDMARHVNVDLSVIVAQSCKEHNVQFVYISTDHLFSGKNPLVSEEEPVSPMNLYGETKYEAERKILELSKDFLAIRTNFYGWGPTYRHSFSDFIIDTLRSGNPVLLFDDFFYTPILIDELAQTVMMLLDVEAGGIFNIAGNERISKYEFGVRLAQKFQLDTGLIQAVKFSDRPDLVKRPTDLSLSNKKVSSFLNKDIGDIEGNIIQLYQQEKNGFATLIKSV